MKTRLWIEIVRQKIANQGRVLRLLNRKGGEQLIDLSEKVLNQRADYCEAAGAKMYFGILQPGITRREGRLYETQVVFDCRRVSINRSGVVYANFTGSESNGEASAPDERA